MSSQGELTPIKEDALLDGRVRLLQGREGYRAAVDPVLLAAAVVAKSGESVLDLGCGVGAASLCLAARTAGVRVRGIDIQAPLVDLAGRNAALNACSERVSFLPGDLLAPPDGIGEGAFDHVMANPPYLRADSGHPPPDPAKAAANVEGAADLPAWVGAAARAVRRKGSVTFIHRADRIDDLLAACHGLLGELVVFPIWPARDKAAKRVIVRGRKGVAGPARISPGLILHGGDGGYSPRATAVLRDAAALPLDGTLT